LGDESVDGFDLDTLASAKIPQPRRFDVIVDFGCDDGEESEIPYDLIGGSGTLEPLEELLQDESRRDNGVTHPE